MSGRKLVTPSTINTSLRWNPSGILQAIMKTALERENRFRLKAD